MKDVTIEVATSFFVAKKRKREFNMQIKKSTTKTFKGGYAAEKAMEELGFQTLEDLESQGFNVLNIEEAGTNDDGVKFIRIYVHTPEIKPFSVKLEESAQLLKSIDKIELYAPIRFENLQACVIAKKGNPKAVYYKADNIEVL